MLSYLLFSPSWVTTDKSGNVYVVDTLNYRIIKFDGDGNKLTEFGGKAGPVSFRVLAVTVDDGVISMSQISRIIVCRNLNLRETCSQMGGKGL